jgi:hypothetical protein
MASPITDLTTEHERDDATSSDDRRRRKKSRAASGRLLDLKAAEAYSGISAWTLRDLIASGDLPVGGVAERRRHHGSANSFLNPQLRGSKSVPEPARTR